MLEHYAGVLWLLDRFGLATYFLYRFSLSIAREPIAVIASLFTLLLIGKNRFSANRRDIWAWRESREPIPIHKRVISGAILSGLALSPIVTHLAFSGDSDALAHMPTIGYWAMLLTLAGASAVIIGLFHWVLYDFHKDAGS